MTRQGDIKLWENVFPRLVEIMLLALRLRLLTSRHMMLSETEVDIKDWIKVACCWVNDGCESC